MIVPHNEKQSINLHITYKSITIALSVLFLLILISALNVLSHSGTIHEISELNLSNADFIRQSSKMKTEIDLLHEEIEFYYKKISKLYLKLGGNPSIVLKGAGGNDISAEKTEVKNEISPETFKLKNDAHNLKISNELIHEIIKMVKKRKGAIKNTPSIWPVKGYIMNPFGKYHSQTTGREVYNNGIDIGTFPGAEVITTAPGIIYDISFSEKTGYIIRISHKYGWKTIYSNLERVNVKKNQTISKGDLLGYVGKSVTSSTYILHYEVHVGTQTINPYSFLNQIQEFVK